MLKNIQTLLKQGQAKVTSGQLKAALKIFEEIIKQDPKCDLAFLQAGRLYFQRKDFVKAVPLLIWAAKLQPKDFESNFWAGLVLTRNSQFKESLIYFEQANKIIPEDTINLEAWGCALCLAGDFIAGRKVLKKAYQIDPNSPTLCNGLATSYLLGEKVEPLRALEWIEKGLKIAPKDSLLLNSLRKAKNLLKQLKAKDKKVKKISVARVESKEIFPIKEIPKDVYRYCDGFCSHCQLRVDCAAYQKRLEFENRCLKHGKDPRSVDTVIEEIETKFNDMRNFLEKDLEKLGIMIKVVSNSDIKQEKKIDDQVTNSQLFKETQKFARQSESFLEIIYRYLEKQSEVSGEMKDDLEILDHYSQLTLAKLYQALKQLAITANDLEAFKNLALVQSALEASLGAVQRLTAANRREWVIEGSLMTTLIKELLSFMNEYYPDLEGYRRQIIFNAR